MNLGNTLEEMGQVDQAIAIFRKAIRLKNDHRNAHHVLGRALAKKGNQDEAIAEFQEASASRRIIP